MTHQISSEKILLINGWWEDLLSDEIVSKYTELLKRCELSIPKNALEDDALKAQNEREEECKQFGNQKVERVFRVKNIEIVLKNNYTPLPGESKINGIYLSAEEFTNVSKFVTEAINQRDETTVELACRRKWD